MLRDQLIGVWKLVSYEFRLADGILIRPMGQGVQGLLIYDASGYMSLQIVDPDRPKFSTEDWMSGSDAEIRSAWEGIVAYYGTFDIDEQRAMIVHHVHGSAFPNWTGTDRPQFFEFKDERLTLLTFPLTMSKEQLVGQLVWERVK
jgi:hypothetical protein